MLGQVIFLRDALGHVPRPRTLALVALATAPLTLIVGIAASTAVLLAVAIADTLRRAIGRGIPIARQ